MIRYVLAVILAASMMTLSMGALGDTAVHNANSQVETELDRLETGADSLLYDEETVPNNVQDPTREMALSFPQDSMFSTDIDEVQFEPSLGTGTTRVTYQIDGTKRQRILDVPLVDTAYDSFTLEGANDLNLQLRLERDEDDRRVIVVKRKSETIIRPGAFVIRQVETNGPTTAGNTVTFDVTVEHTGDARDTREMKVQAELPGGGNVEQRESITLAPDEQTTKQVLFSTIPGESGDLTATIETRHNDDPQDTQTRTVSVLSDNEFGIEILDAGTEQVGDDTHCTLNPCTGIKRPDALAVQTRLDNRDGIETSQRVDFSVDGLDQDETRSVSADGGRTAYETFYVNTDGVSLQDYTVNVETGDASDQETVTVLDSNFIPSIEEWSLDTDDSALQTTVSVDNTGQLEDSQSIKVTLATEDGTTVARGRTDVHLLGGGGPKTTTVRVPLPSDFTGGEYTLTARSDDDSDSETATIDSNFDVTITDMSTKPDSNKIQATVAVENIGTVPDTQSIDVRIDDGDGNWIGSDTKSVTLAPDDGRVTKTFSVSHKAQYTEYHATASSDDDTATASHTVQPEFTVESIDTNTRFMGVSMGLLDWETDVTVKIRNNGRVASTQEVSVTAQFFTLLTSSSTETVTDITVSAGTSKTTTVTFDGSADEITAETTSNYKSPKKGNSVTVDV